jgi:peptide deformylase
VRLYGDPVLRRRAAPVAATAAETRRLLDGMWEVLGTAGVGLAAPQIGVSARVIVVRDPRRSGGRGRHELINPVLERVYGPRRPFEEGCLSFPGLYLKIWRPQGMAVAYETPAGAPARREDAGRVARIVQHELDHLEGELYIDRLPRWRRLLLEPRLWSLRRRGAREDTG